VLCLAALCLELLWSLAVGSWSFPARNSVPYALTHLVTPSPCHLVILPPAACRLPPANSHCRLPTAVRRLICCLPPAARCLLHHSCLNASMGFMRAAMMAGYRPKTMPITA